jgi:hypothetical protein
MARLLSVAKTLMSGNRVSKARFQNYSSCSKALHGLSGNEWSPTINHAYTPYAYYSMQFCTQGPAPESRQHTGWREAEGPQGVSPSAASSTVSAMAVNICSSDLG